MSRALCMIFIAQLLMGCATRKKTSGVMPERGICAHRGAMDTHPENSLAALRECLNRDHSIYWKNR